MSYLINPMAGEISRLKWWLSQLLIIAILIIGVVTIFAINSNAGTLDPDSFTGKLWPVMALTGYINLCACVNRLRDTGRTGWWYLAHFIPFIGPFIILYFCGIEKGSSKMSYDMFGETGSGVDADEIIARYQSGQSQASHYTPPNAQPTTAKPQPIRQAPQGFGKRKGFQGNWA